MNALARWLARFAGVTGVVAIGIVSIVPGQLRPHVAQELWAAGQLEHFFAYLCIAGSFPVWMRHRDLPRIGAFFIGYAALLELVQLLVPNRGARLIDFTAGAAGAIIGLVLGARLFRQRNNKQAQEAQHVSSEPFI